MRQLTRYRRVVVPLDDERFALDNDNLAHGARLWANLLSLMATNAWLEQRNRRLVELPMNGVVAVEAAPEDYEVAYKVFKAVCSGTSVLQLKKSHRKILNSLYDLHKEQGHREAFTIREVAQQSKVARSTVSDNKTYLATSVKLIKEVEGHGIALVQGADPSWWSTDDLMAGFPTPAQVRSWWLEESPDLPEPAGQPGQPDNTPSEDG